MTRIAHVFAILVISTGVFLVGLPVLPIEPSPNAISPLAALADDDDDGNGNGNGNGDDDSDNGGGDDDSDSGGGDDDDDGGGRGDDDDDDDGRNRIPGSVSQEPRRDGYDVGREILAIDADPALLRNLEAEGFVRTERRILSSLQISVTRLTIPNTLSLPAAIARARQLAPGAAYEPNPVYRIATDETEPPQVTQAPCEGLQCYAHDLVGWPSNPHRCGNGLRIGMADTAVDPRHPALRGRAVRQERFAPPGLDELSPADHGTAVASLLVGHPPSGYAGMLPSAALYAADVFHVDRMGEPQATLADLVDGLDWLATQQVSVINISMTGPPNRLLQTAVEVLDRRGIGVVSAAGNGGPAAAPVFPAAYDSVISVTAIDQTQRAYRLANQGDYIAFASPGVEVWSAAEGGAGRFRTGTSVAAAHVTAALAEIVGNGDTVESALRTLQADARDLGAPGRDRVFGWGLIQASPNCGG